jgi:hypothetical protein
LTLTPMLYMVYGEAAIVKKSREITRALMKAGIVAPAPAE